MANSYDLNWVKVFTLLLLLPFNSFVLFRLQQNIMHVRT